MGRVVFSEEEFWGERKTRLAGKCVTWGKMLRELVSPWGKS